MKKILVVFGTRPEAIKMAPLVKKLKESKRFQTKVMVTGQHRQMLDQVLDLFNIVPDYDLNLMRPNQNLTDITIGVLAGCRDVLKEFCPDLVCVHGDTTTSFATSLACFYQQIKVAHIEAGLRTYNVYSPYPEEMNRQFVTTLSHFHFAPTNECKENLLNEKVPPESILVCGNTVIDALYYCVDLIQTDDSFEKKIKEEMQSFLVSSPYVLITGHRRENFGEGLRQICEGIVALAQKYPHINFIYPVHFNPNVRITVNEILGNHSNIHLVEPMGYLQFVYMMMNSCLILTDSGGIQEEAPSLGKPVLLMRENTERPEALQTGIVKIVGTNANKIVLEASPILDKISTKTPYEKKTTPFGDGKTSEKIVKFIESKL